MDGVGLGEGGRVRRLQATVQGWREGRGWEEAGREDAELAVPPGFPELAKSSLFSFLGVSNQETFFQHSHSHDSEPLYP